MFEGVSSLIERARSVGVQAHVIEVQTFDELLGDLVRQLDDIPVETLEQIGANAKRSTDITPEPPGTTWPVIRLNALPLTEWPSVCRRIECTIGGAKDVRDAVVAAEADVIAGRRNVGVLGFGSDEEIRKAFSRFKITAFDFHSIEAARLRYESVELGLIKDAFARSIARHRPLFVQRRGATYFFAVKENGPAAELVLLKQVAKDLIGVVPSTKLNWAEAIRVRLEYRLSRLWVVFEPTIWFENTQDDDERYAAAEFVGQRMASRYNSQWNSLIAAWASILLGDSKKLKAFDTSEGADATFKLGPTTAFSRRSKKR